MLRYSSVHIATRTQIDLISAYSRNFLDLFAYAADLESTSQNEVVVEALDAVLNPLNLAQSSRAPMKLEVPKGQKIDGLHVLEYFCKETKFPIFCDAINLGGRLYDLVSIAAAHGLGQYVGTKLNEGIPLTRKMRAPLLYAASCSVLADIWAQESLDGNSAVTAQAPTLMRLLLEKDADPNATYNGISPLGFLIRTCSTTDSVNLLPASWEALF